MIVYIASDSTLQIPKGLGNFAADSVDIEPLSGSVIELSATTVTLSGAVETLEGETNKNKADIAALSGKVDNLSSSTITGLDTRVSGNTEDIAALSAQTTANTAHIETLSASTVAMNNSVTANTANIATLSGITSGLAVSVETLGEVKEDIYIYLKDLTAMTIEEKKAAWKALEEKYLAGHSIYLVAKSATSSTTDLILPLAKYQPHTEGQPYTGYFGFSVIDGGGNAFYDVTFWQRGDILGNTGTRIMRKEMYKLPRASSGTLGGIKVGSGLTMSGDFLNLEIGEGLGFSGNTLVVSGGSKIYDAFIVAQYDNDNKSLTGITHSTKATMWETYKIERNEGYARKTIVAYVHTGDIVPARFNLIYVDGNMDENESGVKLYFGAVYNSIADSSLHSVRFSLSKNVETDVYTIGDIVEYSYTATV